MKAVAVIAALILMAGTCQAGEWPTIGHDPQRTGFSENWGPDSPCIAWEVNVGAAPSSPSVANNMVYFGAENVIYALNAFNGSTIWSVEVDGEVSPPTVYNQRVYFGTRQGTLYCLDGKNGGTVWTCTVEGSIAEPFAIINDFLYTVTSEGHLYALRASTGGFIWTTSLDDRTSAPATDGNLIVVATDAGELTALDTSGRTVWSTSVGELSTSFPTILDESVWIGAKNRLFAIRNGGTWRRIEFQTDVKCISIRGERMYLGLANGRVKAMFENGTEIWDFWAPEEVVPCVAATDNLVFVASGGHLQCLSSMSGEVVWGIHLGNGATTSPAIAYGKIFIGASDGRIYCIGSWGSIPNGGIWTGVLYICIAFILLLILYFLERISHKVKK